MFYFWQGTFRFGLVQHLGDASRKKHFFGSAFFNDINPAGFVVYTTCVVSAAPVICTAVRWDLYYITSPAGGISLLPQQKYHVAGQHITNLVN
ncbi:MAG TPA: hypothetical protein VFD23_03570, partial [Clostridia bacterium]|nr:hypothetical protein [Clostridia bacterium]